MSSIVFYLNGEKRVLDFNEDLSLSPFCSVLDYLREKEHFMGTKEGCGVGDCGACTVCLAQMQNYFPENNLFSKDIAPEIVFYAVNSCLLLLPMLSGKHLFTIEWLSSMKKPHPILRALAEKRGAQCGFCSPGMVMSAYAHYRNGKPFTREEIERTISGNLCRCTGYESILNGMMEIENIPRLKEPDPEFDEELLSRLREEIIIERSPRLYIKPSSLKSLLVYKQKYRDAVIISGATDTAVLLRKKAINNSVFLDISDIAQLSECEVYDNHIYIGGTTSIEQLKFILEREYPAAAKYLSSFASLQIRNKGTVAGSIAGSSPVGDLMPLLLSLDGSIILVSKEGRRSVEATSFIVSYRKNVTHNNEIISAITIPKRKKGGFLFCHKMSKRKDLDIATMSCCIYLEVVNKKIVKALTGFGGMDAVPKSSCSVEEFLTGKEMTLETFEKAGEIAVKDFSPISDVRGSAQGRLNMVKNLFVKCFLEYETER